MSASGSPAWQIDQLMVGDDEAVSRTQGRIRRRKGPQPDVLSEGRLHAANGTRNTVNSGTFWPVMPSSICLNDFATAVTTDGIVTYKVYALTEKARLQAEPAEKELRISVEGLQRRRGGVMKTRGSSSGVIRGSGKFLKNKIMAWLHANKGWALLLSGSGSREDIYVHHERQVAAVPNSDLLSRCGTGTWPTALRTGTNLCVPFAVAISCVVVLRKFEATTDISELDKQKVLDKILGSYCAGSSVSSMRNTVANLNKSLTGAVPPIKMTRVDRSTKLKFLEMLRHSHDCALHAAFYKEHSDLEGAKFLACTCPDWKSLIGITSGTREQEKAGIVFIVRFRSKKADHTLSIDLNNALIFDVEEQEPVTLSFFSLGACSGLGWDVEADTLGKTIHEFRAIEDEKWATGRWLSSSQGVEALQCPID